jgi:hypothetical protein
MVLKLGHFGVDQKCLKSVKMWCWRRMEKISWYDRVRNEEVYIDSRRREIFCKK